MVRQSMSDADDDQRTSPNRSVQREGALQQIAVVYLRRVLIAPFFVSAILNENMLTQNARARAKSRGFVSGLPDLYVAQPCGHTWLELKYGHNKPSDAQLHVKVEMQKAGVTVHFCWSIHDIHHALCSEMFSLHPNAYNMTTEFDERSLAAVRRAELRAQKPHAKAHAERPTQSRIRRAHRAGVWAKPLLPGDV